MENDPAWTEDLRVLGKWVDQAMGKGGTTTETAAAVSRAVINTIVNRPDAIISGVPIRVPGTTIYWTAIIDAERRRISIVAIEPEPHPGL